MWVSRGAKSMTPAAGGASPRRANAGPVIEAAAAAGTRRVMLVIDRLRALLVPAGNPGLAPHRRATAWPEDAVRTRVAEALDRTALSPLRREQVLGLALAWHDHWDAAHAVAQAHEGDPDCDLLHAVLHRREGDRDNTRYWLRRLGHHPAWDHLPPVAAAEGLSELTDRGGRWRAEAFAERCLAAKPAQVPALVRLQAAELLALLDHLALHPAVATARPQDRP